MTRRARRWLRRAWFGPWDWLAHASSARDRRALAGWMLVLYIATTPLRFQFKDVVWMVWALSEVAIVISLLTIVAAETPVEDEAT